MSEHPLDFLKDYSVKHEEDPKPTVSAACFGPEPEPGDSKTDFLAGSSESKPKGSKSNKGKGRQGRKRLSVTKKELQRSQIRERRKLARRVIIEKCACHLSCTTKITPEQRKALNESYWQLEHIEQRKFVRNHTVQGQVKRRRVPVDPLGGADVKKAHSYAFYLPDDKGQLQAICCTFFLNTLGFRKGCGNHIYRAHMRDDLSDNRGKYERDHSLRDAVWDDILSYAPRTYHKGLKYSATALYLPNQLNAKMMHAYFKARREAVGEKPGSASFYCAILREMDVHFVEMDDFQIPERKPIIQRVPSPQPVEPPVCELREMVDMHPNEQAPPVPSYKQSPPVEQYEAAHSHQNMEHSSMQSYDVEQKMIVPHYTDVAHHSATAIHSVNIKQEPYYGLSVESMNVPPEAHYPEENDDYSDTYSNMVVVPDYSESSYHETPCNVVLALETKVELVPDDKHCFQPELPPQNHAQTLAPPLSTAVEHKLERKAQPTKTPSSSEPTIELPVLPEGYPPIKHTKKFIARVRNIAKRKQSHPVLALECNCHLACREKITPEQQQRINQQYWSLGFCDQRMFMLEHTERHSIKRRRAKQTSGVVRKGYTYSYRLSDEKGGYQAVCCQFFLNTIGFGAGSGNVIYRAHQVELSEAISDKRGKFVRDTTLRDMMDEDILSFFSIEQQESGGPLDLSSTDWSPKKMYNQYVKRQAEAGNDKPGSFGFYWRRVKHMKVQFAPKPEPKASGKKAARSSSHKRPITIIDTTPYQLGFNMPS